MHVEFFAKEGTKDKAGKPVEYLRASGHHGKDVVERPATDADKRRFKSEYAAFKAQTQ